MQDAPRDYTTGGYDDRWQRAAPRWDSSADPDRGDWQAPQQGVWPRAPEPDQSGRPPAYGDVPYEGEGGRWSGGSEARGAVPYGSDWSRGFSGDSYDRSGEDARYRFRGDPQLPGDGRSLPGDRAPYRYRPLTENERARQGEWQWERGDRNGPYRRSAPGPEWDYPPRPAFGFEPVPDRGR